MTNNLKAVIVVLLLQLALLSLMLAIPGSSVFAVAVLAFACGSTATFAFVMWDRPKFL